MYTIFTSNENVSDMAVMEGANHVCSIWVQRFESGRYLLKVTKYENVDLRFEVREKGDDNAGDNEENAPPEVVRLPKKS